MTKEEADKICYSKIKECLAEIKKMNAFQMKNIAKGIVYLDSAQEIVDYISSEINDNGKLAKEDLENSLMLLGKLYDKMKSNQCVYESSNNLLYLKKYIFSILNG